MEILNSLSLAQWIFVIIGLAIAGSAAVPWIREKLDEWSMVNRLKADEAVRKLGGCCDLKDHDLTNLVCKWECLADACEYMGLDAATNKLDEVFPLLIEVRTDDPDEEEF
jgi:hypothetical protein